MIRQDDRATIDPEHATALVEAARAVQSEARSFGEDPNEGYLFLHAALADALRRRTAPDARHPSRVPAFACEGESRPRPIAAARDLTGRRAPGPAPAGAHRGPRKTSSG